MDNILISKELLKNVRRGMGVAYAFVLPVFYAEGATALEFAIVLPILLLLLLGIVEYSVVMYASAVLEGATVTAAREGTTGYSGTSGLSRQQYITNLIQQKVSGLLDPSRLQIIAQTFNADYSNLTPPNPCYNPPLPAPQTCPATVDVGDANSVVEYTVVYPWPLSTPFLQTVMDTNSNVFVLSSSAVVKNEPFGSTGGPVPPTGPDPGPVPTPYPASPAPAPAPAPVPTSSAPPAPYQLPQ